MTLHLDLPKQRLDLVFVGTVTTSGLTVGYLSSGRPALGLAAVVFLGGIAFVAVRPVACAVLAVPAVFLPVSVGLGSALSLSDVLLIAGSLLALPALMKTRQLPASGAMHRAFLLYLVLLVPSLVLHPTAPAGQEFVHRIVLVSGALLVGAWLAQEDRVRTALRLLVLMASAFAALAVLTFATNGFEPAYPLGFHKNYVGSLVALVLVALLCAPATVSISLLPRLAVIIVLVAGLMATQSRGAILGAAVGALLWLFAPRDRYGLNRRGSRVAAGALAAIFAVYALSSVQAQLGAENKETNSAGVRLDVETYTQELWRSSPLLGIGIRYYNSGDFGRLATASNNAINNELAESGVVGASGFVLFHLIALRLLWRARRSPLGLAALALFAGQLLHGMFDIYWSSGITPLPFILAGMALAQPRVGDEEPQAASEAASRDVAR